MHKELDKQFIKYVLPSICITILNAFYGVVDGFFIGRSVGDNGLAAINIAWPIAALITATGTGIGVGGSVFMSIKKGEDDIEGIKKVRGNTFSLLIFSTIIFTIFMYTFCTKILQFLGAEGEIFNYAKDYADIIIIGSICQFFASGINPILRNSGKPNRAMAFMISGLITNIFLDALFVQVLNLGLFGAGFATILAQGVTAILGVSSLFIDEHKNLKLKDFKLEKEIIARIVRIGISPFGLSFAPSAIIVITNWQALKYGGTLAVATYSILSYSMSTVQSMLQGVSDGVQPLISYYNGSNERSKINYLRKKTIKFTLILAIFLIIIFMLIRGIFPIIFGASEEVAKMTYKAMTVVTLGFIFIGINKFTCSYFYATNKPQISGFLVYIDPLIFSPLFLIILPLFLGTTGLWLALPFTQFSVSLFSIYFYKKYARDLSNL